MTRVVKRVDESDITVRKAQYQHINVIIQYLAICMYPVVKAPDYVASYIHVAIAT